MKPRTWGVDSGRILVFEEKHSKRYFQATTGDQIHQVALTILKERVDEGWIREPEMPKLELLEMTDEYINSLASNALKMTAKVERNNQRQQAREYQEEARAFLEAQLALSTNDGAKAYEILYSRDDHEYEGFTFESLENV